MFNKKPKWMIDSFHSRNNHRKSFDNIYDSLKQKRTQIGIDLFRPWEKTKGPFKQTTTYYAFDRIRYVTKKDV